GVQFALYLGFALLTGEVFVVRISHGGGPNGNVAMITSQGLPVPPWSGCPSSGVQHEFSTRSRPAGPAGSAGTGRTDHRRGASSGRQCLRSGGVDGAGAVHHGAPGRGGDGRVQS